MLFSATATKVSESAWMIGSRAGSPSSAAIGPASTMVATVSSAPVSTATQKAVSIWRRVSVGRWMSASPRPWSTSSWARATNTLASATSPKSTGVSSRARRMKMISPRS